MPETLPIPEQLTILFETILKDDGSPYTMKEVARMTGVSLATMSQLRAGKVPNPQFNTLHAISTFFGVQLNYWGARTREECYAIIHEGRRDEGGEQLTEIGHMASRLSPDAQRDLLKVILWAQAAEQRLRKGEGLDTMPHLEDYNDADC